MKKTTLIILVTIFSFTTKAQHFGVTADVGMSRINKIVGKSIKVENKSKIYYGIGVFYAKIPVESRWGFRTSIDYNKRGAGSYYEGFPWYGIDSDYVVYETNESTKSLNLTFTPTLNISNKFQFLLGPTIGYTLGSRDGFTETYYKTSAKNEVLEIRTDTRSFNGISFSYRLHYGVKTGINVKVSNYLDVGLNYQYARLLRYGNPRYRPFYNIINITTNIYLKKRD